MSGRAIAQDKIVLFGDSITQFSSQLRAGCFNLQPQLQDDYIRRLDVVNRGFSGYHTDQGRSMIEPILQGENTRYSKVRLVVLFFGSNDAATRPDGSHLVDIDRYRENLCYISTAVQKTGAKLIITGPAAFNAKQVGSSTDRDTRTFREYAQVAGEVAVQVNAGFINLWDDFMQSVGWDGELEKPLPGEVDYEGPIDMSHLFTDGLHYSANGYRLWYAGIKQRISQHFPSLLPDHLPETVPPWVAVNDDGHRGSSRGRHLGCCIQ
jgi:lysophospholipase L1-like esterase